MSKMPLDSMKLNANGQWSNVNSVDEAQKKFDEVSTKHANGLATYSEYLEAWSELSKAHKANQMLPGKINVTIPQGWTPNVGYYDTSDVWNGGIWNNTSNPGTQSCVHDWKIYDSGFTRLEYCSKCNEERKLD